MRKKVTKKPTKRDPKNQKREYEILGAASVITTAALVISIFVASSLDVVIIRSEQYASVLAGVLVDLANDDRADNRLDGLTINPVLTEAAQLKANDMAAKGYFAHTSPEGVDPWHWFDEVGYEYSYAGENLAVDFNDSSAVNTAWMNSPTHRANLLDQHYTEIGIATAEGFYQGRPTTFVVQAFGTPLADSTPAPETKPQPKPKPQSVPATAIATTSRVLGESTELPKEPEVAAPVEKAVAPVANASVVQHVAASPQRSLKYAYYALAMIVLVALVVAAGFEFHVRHLKKAFAAGALIALMAVLFAVSDRYLFPAPIVPDAMMAASAVSR